MDKKEKSHGQMLQDKLCLRSRNGYETASEEQLAQADDFCKKYMEFLDCCKTEREAVDYTCRAARELGFAAFDPKAPVHPGERIYLNNRGKSVILVRMGQRPLEDGMKIVMAHLDSPRLDLKPVPLYEDGELAFFKTNYYGGIKKYQWPTLPLALHGVIYKADGSQVTVRIGEEESDPVFCVTDLLPHLAREQMDKKLLKAFTGEDLNVLVGSRPFGDDSVSEKVKLQLLSILFEKYGITESDFVSAELEMVPVFRAREVGFDRSMIGAYGQDDRVCAYPCYRAFAEAQAPQFTTVCLLCDKEETGSDGNTGLASIFFYAFVQQLSAAAGCDANEVLRRSVCLSADVTAAFDPNYPSVHDRNNAAYLNHGVSVMKYSGSGGKGSTSDASAETMQYFRRLFDEKQIQWQIGCLGKVDAGGGGTLAKYIADLNVDVLDIGVPVLSMHAPFEVTSKLDVYMAYLAFKVFLEAAQ